MAWTGIIPRWIHRSKQAVLLYIYCVSTYRNISKFKNFTIIVHVKLAFESSKLRNEFGTIFFPNSRLFKATETELSGSFTGRFCKFHTRRPATVDMRPISNLGLSYSNYDKWYQLPMHLQPAAMYNNRWKILQQQDPIQLR